MSILVAAGSSRIQVPRVKGLTIQEAAHRLRDEGLAVADVQGDGEVVTSQIPAAGLRVERGTAIRLFMRDPP